MAGEGVRALRVALIGAGNVAAVLGEALFAVGVPIVAVYSKREERARRLAGRLACPPFWGDALPCVGAEVYLVAVSDRACRPVCERLVGRGAVVAHTSGATPLLELPDCETGVFYPLQTFTAGRAVRMKEVPLFLEASSPGAMGLLRRLAGCISERVYEVETARRQWLHLLGVVSCNFVNHLLALSARVSEAKGVPFACLEPLVRETVDKAFVMGPLAAQTGPAVRGDRVTMSCHEALLAGQYPEAAALYRALSESIARLHAVDEDSEE